MKLHLSLTLPTKINSKRTGNLNLKPVTVKFLEENVRSLTSVLAMNFLDLMSKVKTTKEKISKWHYIKLKSCTAMETTNTMTRQPVEWEELQIMLTYLPSSRGSSWPRDWTCNSCVTGITNQNIWRIHTTQEQRTKQSNFKMGRLLNRHFPKENINIVNRYIKLCSTSLIRNVYIKTTWGMTL